MPTAKENDRRATTNLDQIIAAAVSSVTMSSSAGRTCGTPPCPRCPWNTLLSQLKTTGLRSAWAEEEGVKWAWHPTRDDSLGAWLLGTCLCLVFSLRVPCLCLCSLVCRCVRACASAPACPKAIRSKPWWFFSEQCHQRKWPHDRRDYHNRCCRPGPAFWDTAGSGRLVPFYLTAAPPERWCRLDAACATLPPLPLRLLQRYANDVTSHRHIVCPQDL